MYWNKTTNPEGKRLLAYAVPSMVNISLFGILMSLLIRIYTHKFTAFAFLGL
jgi:hypothetical protein